LKEDICADTGVAGGVFDRWFVGVGVVAATLSALGVSLQGFDGAVVALFVPGLYVIGMFVDFVGWFILRSHRRRIKERIYKGHDFGGRKVFDRDPVILVHAPEVAKANEMYSSKDRIARSAVVSAILATVVLGTRLWSAGRVPLCIACVAVGAVVSLLCWGMWARFQRVSYEYEVQALLVVEEKLRAEQKDE